MAYNGYTNAFGGGDYLNFLQKYKDQWERFYNKNIEGQAAGWANDPNVARNANWKGSDFYNNAMKAAPDFWNNWYQQHGWVQTHPGQWTLASNPALQLGSGQPTQLPANVVAGRKQLGSIADQLQAAADKAAIPPPPTGKPILTGQPIPPAVNYVDSSRLEEGKGFSKFKRQARGTDRFKMVNDIINQYYK